jgi:hypothetical protein
MASLKMSFKGHNIWEQLYNVTNLQLHVQLFSINTEQLYEHIYKRNCPTQHNQQFEVHNLGPPTDHHQINTLFGTHKETTKLSETWERVPSCCTTVQKRV